MQADEQILQNIEALSKKLDSVVQLRIDFNNHILSETPHVSCKYNTKATIAIKEELAIMYPTLDKRIRDLEDEKVKTAATMKTTWILLITMTSIVTFVVQTIVDVYFK